MTLGCPEDAGLFCSVNLTLFSCVIIFCRANCAKSNYVNDVVKNQN